MAIASSRFLYMYFSRIIIVVHFIVDLRTYVKYIMKFFLFLGNVLCPMCVELFTFHNQEHTSAKYSRRDYLKFTALTDTPNLIVFKLKSKLIGNFVLKMKY